MKMADPNGTRCPPTATCRNWLATRPARSRGGPRVRWSRSTMRSTLAVASGMLSHRPGRGRSDAGVPERSDRRSPARSARHSTEATRRPSSRVRPRSPTFSPRWRGRPKTGRERARSGKTRPRAQASRRPHRTPYARACLALPGPRRRGRWVASRADSGSAVPAPQARPRKGRRFEATVVSHPETALSTKDLIACST